MDDLMKKYWAFILVLILIPFPCWAQSITGTVVDSDGQSIAFANVKLCQSADSTIIAGCTTDENGNFNFETKCTDRMYLRISFVGYETKCVELVESGASPIHVTLESMRLDEVVVTARRKLYQQKMVK